MVPRRKRADKVCFVSLSAYPLLAGENMGFVGGAEKCLVQLAKEVSKRGFKISFITYGDGGEPIEYIDKIKVIKVYKRSSIHRLSPLIKAWHLWQALAKAKADVYLESPALAGIVPLFCRLNGKKSILTIASDRDVDPQERHKIHQLPFALAQKFNIKLASKIAVQNKYQQRMLTQNFKRASVLIKNPLLLSDREVPRKFKPPLVIWIGTIRPIKQAELFLELAKALPNTHFQMIGGQALGEELYFTSIQEAAYHIPNLDFLGFVSPDEIEPYLAKASVLVNTSIIEGFPNTFLEAWARYTPVVSINADPDEVICRSRLGLHSGSFGQTVKDIKTLLNNEELRQEMGRNGRKYVEHEHNAQKIMGQYARLFSA